MKKNLNKRKCLVFGALIFTSLISAQGTIDLQTPANEIGDQIRAITPIVLGIGFIIACFANMKHFYGENSDLKKGIINIVLFAIIIGVMYGLIRWVLQQTI